MVGNKLLDWCNRTRPTPHAGLTRSVVHGLISFYYTVVHPYHLLSLHSYLVHDDPFCADPRSPPLPATINPEQTVYDAKRLIGRRFADKEVQKDMKHWPFIVIDKATKPMIRVKVKGEEKTLAPEEISAMVGVV